MRPLAAHCLLGLGRLYRRAGSADLAHESLDAAGKSFAAMGMTLRTLVGSRGASAHAGA